MIEITMQRFQLYLSILYNNLYGWRLIILYVDIVHYRSIKVEQKSYFIPTFRIVTILS